MDLIKVIQSIHDKINFNFLLMMMKALRVDNNEHIPNRLK